MKTIALKRYGHALSINDAFELKFNKISILRDVCQQVGLVLRERDYNFPNTEVKKYAELPFDVEDIVDIAPVIKFIDVNSLYLMEGVQ